MSISKNLALNLSIGLTICLGSLSLSLPSVAIDTATTRSKVKAAKTSPANYINFPAVGVKLTQPQGFDRSGNFDGFQQVSTQSSILVTKLPTPFNNVRDGFTAKNLLTRGMKLERKEKISIDGNPGLLLRVSQTAFGQKFGKWLVIFGKGEETILMTATFPRDRAAKLAPQLKSTLLAAKIDTSPVPPIGSTIGFTIATNDRMKLTTEVAKALLYTKDGVMPIKSPTDPIFLAALSLSEVTVIDPKKYATDRLYKTAQIKVDKISQEQPIKIDNLDGFETIATGKDTAGTPLVIYQTMLFKDRSYILMQGIVGEKDSNNYLPVFQSMARSFKRSTK
jgi:hypothetical protein